MVSRALDLSARLRASRLDELASSSLSLQRSTCSPPKQRRSSGVFAHDLPALAMALVWSTQRLQTNPRTPSATTLQQSRDGQLLLVGDHDLYIFVRRRRLTRPDIEHADVVSALALLLSLVLRRPTLTSRHSRRDQRSASIQWTLQRQSGPS